MADKHSPAVVELRRYTLHPGARETLIALFERELVESQEAVGMSSPGLGFDDFHDPDVFVWLRGFEDLPSERPRSPRSTVARSGPAIATPRTRRWLTPTTSCCCDQRPAIAGCDAATCRQIGSLLVTTYHLRQPADRGFLEAFTTTIEPGLSSGGGRSVGVYVTDPTPNNWPDLPVREGEEVLIALRAFGDEAEYRVFLCHGRRHAVRAASGRRGPRRVA